MDCFKVETPTATYLYGKRGAGFASILDKDGRDWVSYRPGGEARGEYRGLPKCGQPTKFFHCGYGYGQYKTDNPFSSRVTVREAGPRPHRVRDAGRQVSLPVGLLPGPRDVDALAYRSADVLVPLRGDAGRQARRRERLRHPPRRPEDHARPALVAGRPLGLLRRGRDPRRVRLRQPPGPGARRGQTPTSPGPSGRSTTGRSRT